MDLHSVCKLLTIIFTFQADNRSLIEFNRMKVQLLFSMSSVFRGAECYSGVCRLNQTGINQETDFKVIF